MTSLESSSDISNPHTMRHLSSLEELERMILVAGKLQEGIGSVESFPEMI